MQPGDTSSSDEITRTLVLDDWTPTARLDFFDDEHTTSTWLASPALGLPEQQNIPFLRVDTHDIISTWDDVEEATRRLQAGEVASALGRVTAPPLAWDEEDYSTRTWNPDHVLRASAAHAHVSRASAGMSAADLASAQLRARARDGAGALVQARPGFVDPHASAAARSAQLSAQAPAAPAARVRVASARATLVGLPGPAQLQARPAQPVVRRAAPPAPRFAPLPLATNAAVPFTETSPWLTPRTQRQLGTMSLLPAVALFAAILAGRVLLSDARPSLQPAPSAPQPPAAAQIDVQAPREPAATPTLAEPRVAEPTTQTAPKATPKLTHSASHYARSRAEHAARDASVAQVASQTADEASAASGEGVLRINSRPWAEVFVDGTPVGNTPQTNLRLPAGTHSVELLNRPMSMSKSLRVNIRPGQTETRVVDLVE
jgi:hypothetical protein